MTVASQVTYKDRFLGGLWGSLVGDALGVPVEFRDRSAVRANPVTDMRGHGTHNQAAGTWSDDSSLLLCTVDSLVRHPFDTADIGRRFVDWYGGKLWTPHGRVFDVGRTTARAICNIQNGHRAEVAGGVSENSNGNGSLMRILPVALRFTAEPLARALDRVHRVSAVTHRHPRSQMACGFFTLLIRELLQSQSPASAYETARTKFESHYGSEAWWSAELAEFETLLPAGLAARTEVEIDSGGYVMDTLAASIWCLLTTDNFEACVLKAVNLGGDADTTGCVTGGLAGVTYGHAQIPAAWIAQLARRQDVEVLFNEFVKG